MKAFVEEYFEKDLFTTWDRHMNYNMNKDIEYLVMISKPGLVIASPFNEKFW